MFQHASRRQSIQERSAPSQLYTYKQSSCYAIQNDKVRLVLCIIITLPCSMLCVPMQPVLAGLHEALSVVDYCCCHVKEPLG